MATQTLLDYRDGTATTTDNTTHVPIVTLDISTGGPGNVALNNCVIFAVAEHAGYDTVAGTAAARSVAALFKVVAGSLSKVGATNVTIATIEDMAGAPTTDFSVAGTVITSYVVGGSADNTVWFGRVRFTILQPT